MRGDIPKALQVRTKFILSAGDLYHGWVRGLCRQFGVRIEQEEQDYLYSPPGRGWSIKCRIDGIVEVDDPDTDQRVKALLEVKSYSIFFRSKFAGYYKNSVLLRGDYAYPAGQEWPTELIWEDYRDQTQISLEITGLDRAYFLPVFRDSGHMAYGSPTRGLIIPKDPLTVERIMGKLDRLYADYIGGRLPEGDYLPNSKECQRCPYWCWDETGRKQKEEVDVVA